MKYTDMTKQAWNLFGKKPAVNKTYSDDDVAKQVRALLQRNLALDKGEIYDNAQLQKDLGMDDLDTIEMIMDLEDKYNTEVDAPTAAKWRTVQDVINWRRNMLKTFPPVAKQLGLNKAQEAIMSNADEYNSSDDLRKALEATESDDDLLADMQAGATKMGYDSVIKKASYAEFKKQAEEESVVSEKDYLKQLQKDIAQWRKSRELGTWGAFKSSIPISLLVAGIAGTAGTALTGNIGAGAALGGISGVVTSAMNTINNRHALPEEASTSFFAAF